MSNSRLHDLLALAHVPRWSIVPCSRFQSVAEHSFRVAAIALSIADRLNKFNLPSSVVIKSEVLQWAIVHDGPEAETGDVPYPVKCPAIRAELSHLEMALCPWFDAEDQRVHPQERLVVSIADRIEWVLFLQEYGQGPKAVAAANGARQQILAYIGEAISKYGWVDMPVIVSGILDDCLVTVTGSLCSPGAESSEGQPSPARTPGTP